MSFRQSDRRLALRAVRTTWASTTDADCQDTLTWRWNGAEMAGTAASRNSDDVELVDNELVSS
jgi:hypothetical protein